MMVVELKMTTRKGRPFTAEFKTDPVKLVRTGSQCFASVARKVELTETALREWLAEPKTRL